MDVIWKGALGGLVTALIVLASKRGDVLPGILPLAPTFALIALLAVGSKGDPDGFRTACLAGAKTIPAYLTFLGVCWLLVGRMDYRLAIIGGLVAWLVVASAIFLLPSRV
ncbi:GlpM family protein [Methylopila sp. M107]|uniref:GlpM family protein n=1 Tax=Methylopila sp. M107 TaxID=1101190 RepID=UPI00036BF842|nr:GlpM family protein [Methylopila sp. M107]